MKKKENVKEEKPKKKIQPIIMKLMVLIALICSAFLIYNISLIRSAEPVICYTLMGILGVIDLIYIIYLIVVLKKKKKKKRIAFFIFIVLYILISVLGSIGIQYLYSRFSSTSKEFITYSTSLVTLVDSPLNNENDVNNLNLGIISDKEAVEEYKIAQEMINEHDWSNKNSIKEYEDFPSMLNALFNNEVDAIFLARNYATKFQSIPGFENIADTTKEIAFKEETLRNEDSLTIAEGDKKASVTEPFTILLMGVDSEINGMDKSAAFNGDSLVLVTFNPKTLTATTVSIPRDSYVPIMCFAGHKENKITHAAWYGASCMIKTIENFTGIKIDYYAKVNFKAVVSIIDALGGVDVDVEYSFCEQNSNRQFGDNMVYVTKGFQTLNGEQALAYSRNRHTWPNYCAKEWNQGQRSDIIRGLHQQKVIQAILAKVKDIKSVDKVLELFDLISMNLDMNMSTDDILSLYSVFKDIIAKGYSESGEVVSFQPLFLKTSDQMIYDESMQLVLSDQIINQGSLDDVVHAMKVNLGLEDAKVIKTFTFSINSPYEQEMIGNGKYSGTKLYALLPDFTGMSKANAASWGQQNGITIVFSNNSNGAVVGQNYPAKKRLDLIPNRTVTLTLAEDSKPSTGTTNKIDCSVDSENSACKIPNFVGKTKSDVNTWVSKLKGVTVKYNEVSVALANGNKVGTIIKQSIAEGTFIKGTKEITLTIVVADNEEEKQKPTETPTPTTPPTTEPETSPEPATKPNEEDTTD